VTARNDPSSAITHNELEDLMRKLVLLLAIAAIAAPSIADAKSKHKRVRHHHARVAKPMVMPNSNVASGMLVGNALSQIFVPAQSLSRQ
jgi:hypothetical protein